MTIATDGVISCGGDAVCLGGGHPAEFEVTGVAHEEYSVILPDVVTLLAADGNESILVDAFTDSVGGMGTLGTDGTDRFRVGATLDVTSGQPAADYSGSYSVSVEYQ